MSRNSPEKPRDAGESFRGKLPRRAHPGRGLFPKIAPFRVCYQRLRLRAHKGVYESRPTDVRAHIGRARKKAPLPAQTRCHGFASQVSNHVKLGPVTTIARRYEPRYCPSCGDPMPERMHGPPGTYCSARCRKRAERARKAAKAGVHAGHPSLMTRTVPARPTQAPAAVPQPRPAPAIVPARAPAASTCQGCGRAGKQYRLRGYTATGNLIAETAVLCTHCRGLVWAAWQSRFSMPAITQA